MEKVRDKELMKKYQEENMETMTGNILFNMENIEETKIMLGKMWKQRKERIIEKEKEEKEEKTKMSNRNTYKGSETNIEKDHSHSSGTLYDFGLTPVNDRGNSDLQRKAESLWRSWNYMEMLRKNKQGPLRQRYKTLLQKQQ